MSNSIKQLMLELIKQGIRFKLSGDKVKLEGDLSSLSDDIKAQLRQHKDEIVELVKAGQQAQSGLSLTKAPEDQAIALSYAQQRLWFIDNLEQGSPEYNMPLALELKGSFEFGALQQAVDTLTQRHDVLCSRFVETDDGVRLVVDNTIKATVSYTDLSNALDAEQQLSQLAAKDAQTPFNLGHPPFFRTHLIKINDKHHGLLLNFHHIVSDGWSEQILIKELFTLYHAYAQGQSNPLPALDWQYRDYAYSQRQWLQGEPLERQLNYWRERLDNLPQVHSLNLDTPQRTRPAKQTFGGNSLSTRLSLSDSQALEHLCRTHDVTLFMLLETAFALLLARVSGESDIAIGTPVSGRVLNGIEPVVGCFLNTLVVRNQLDLSSSFSAALKLNKQQILADFDHQTLPFELLVESLNPERSLSHSPLFQIFFTLNQADGDDQAPNDSLDISAINQPVTSTKFDLSLVAGNQSGQALQLGWTYNTELFSSETISLFAKRFEALLKAIIANPDTPLANLNYLADGEQQLLKQFGQGPQLPAAEFSNLSQWFEHQVELTPDAIAVSDASGQLNYQQLNRRANRIAHGLKAKGVSHGDLVGVLLERHCDLPATLLAIFKTGAGYVPVDPQYPLERCNLILDDAQVKLVVSNEQQKQRLGRGDLNFVLLSELTDLPEHNLACTTDNTTAYVIYTSGSTGKPKGVEISHSNGIALMSWALAHFEPAALAKVAATTSVCFDLSIFELFVPLVSGNQVVLLDNGLAINKDTNITLINTVPSVMQALVAENAIPATVKVINLAGEALKRALVESIFAGYPSVQLFNLYGPSEDTTYSTVAAMSAREDDIPDIGKPLPGGEATVLDTQGQAVGIGVTGELYLAGVGVAKGYLHQPLLSAEKFTAQGYRTGDLVRWRHDGKLDYIGRADRQVKLRGFRIEPGEIEALLSRQTGVDGAAVKVVNDSLVAWLSGNNIESQGEQIQARVTEQLPSHMQPSHWMYLGQLPTTSNGKTDYNALPLPKFTEQRERVAPSNATEQALFDIWQGLLGHDNFGIEDNFFSLGGDSILSIQVVSRARTQGLHFTVKQLFEAQSIKKLAVLCQSSQQIVIPQAALNGEFALLPIQQDFFAQQLSAPHHYNQAVLLKTPHGISEQRLNEMLGAIVERHDALRLKFNDQNHSARFEALTVKVEIDSSVEVAERCNAHQASLDYQHGPLFKAVYFNQVEGGRLLLLAHHLVVDGVSWRILLSDLETLWQNQPLAPKTHGITHWYQALSDYQSKASAQQDYWLRQWQHSRTFAAEHAEPQQLQNHSLTLSTAKTEQLLRDAHSAYRNEVPEILLASMLNAWQQLTGQTGLVVALEGHGRETEVINPHQPLDLTETVGWFTSLYPLALCVTADASQKQRLTQVKEALRTVPDKGLGYGVLRYFEQNQPLTQAENYADTVVFNYLGQFDVARGQDSAFSSAPESMGAFTSKQNRQRQLFALNGMVSEGQLHFAISFDANRIEPEQVEQFAQIWLQTLESDIAHTSESVNRHFTPSDFAQARVDTETLDQWQLAYPNMTDLYRATPMQQGLMFHGLYEAEQQSAQAYTTQTYFDLNGPLDSQAFANAWAAVIARHEILRTAFVGQTTGQIYQLVVAPSDAPLTVFDWRQQSDQSLSEFHALDKAKGFDFAKPPLMRLTLIRMEQKRWHFVWSHHHVLLDGWCLPIVFGEVMQCYHQLCAAQTPSLPAPLAYVNYIKWLNAQDRAQAKAYWQQELAGFYQNQPIDKTFAALGQFHQGDIQLCVKQSDYHEQQLVLPATIKDQLSHLVAASNTTLNLILQAAWSTLVARFSGEEQLLFGTTVSGRPAELPGVETMVGLFINTLPVAVNVGNTQTLAEFLTKLAQQNIDRQAQGFLSLGDIAAQSTMKAAELFDTLVVVENFPVATQSEQTHHHSAITMGEIGSDEHTNYPLTLICHQRQEISIKFGYQPDKFDDATIARLMVLLEQTLAQMTPAALTQPLSAIRPVNQQDVALMQRWGKAQQTFEVQSCVHQLFEQHAAQSPDNIALSYEDEQLSYDELNRRANRMAHYLIAKGVGSDSVVGLEFAPGTELMIAILAILKAGGAYLPLVPELPQDRKDHMLSDCGVELVLSIADFSEAAIARLADYPQHNPKVSTLTPNSLAYIIYTSGSTGLPKGVRIEHRNVVRLLDACEQDFGGFNSDDVWTLFHGYGFDFSVWEIWGALAYGGRLVVVPKELTREPDAFAQLLSQQQVTVLNQTPSAFYPLISQLGTQHSLRYVIFGGEALNYSLLRPWFAGSIHERCQLVNMYGITETCVHATFKTVNADDCHTGQASNIGRALADLEFRVCDPSGELQVPGAPGELWIAGGGVARDYLNRPELTLQKFVTLGDKRYYRSGDSVRWRVGGELDYLGRIDQQVKIRGFRIELGEIETRISAIEGIDNVAVMARNDNQTSVKLVAYLATQGIDNEQVKQQLAKDLPAYMVPELYVQLKQLPLTVNGKIDRKALPAPSESDLGKAAHIAAQTPLQQQLVDLWQQVLGLQQLGISDNFFSLGGDSIIAIQVVARARQQGLQMTVRQLFEQPTIAQLSEVLAAQGQAQALVEHAKAQGTMALLPIQKDFFAQQLAAPHHFNQSLLLNTPQELTGEKLGHIVDALVERHDSLRLVFSQDKAQYLESPENMLRVYRQYSESLCNDIQSGFDLAQGPLAKFVWFEQDQKLLICLHHLIVDGVSWRILLADINDIYAGNPLAPRPMSQQTFSQALAEYANSPQLNQQRLFWQAQTVSQEAFNGERGELRAVSMQLSSEQTKQLLGPSHKPYNTRINDLLLAALTTASNQSKLLVELESHGREALFDDVDISETLGWFTAIYPLALSKQDSWSDTIIAVKEQLRQVPDGGIGYGVLRYLSDTPIDAPQTPGLLFNYLGQFDTSFKAQSAFSAANESMGLPSARQNLPSHPLALNGMVEDGKLGFSLNYDSGLVSQAQAQQLLDNYRQALIDCIDHCLGATALSSPSDFADAKVSLSQLRQWQQQYPDMSALYLATPMQTGLLFHGMMDAQDPAALCGSDYSTQTVLTLEGPLNSDYLRNAWQQVVDRHDILRTAFVGIGEGDIHQLVQAKVSLPFTQLDWTDNAHFDQQLDQLLLDDKALGFDFAQAPLLRMILVKQSDQLSYLIWTHHHSLLDGWCLPLLFKEVGECYRAQLQGTTAQLPEVPPYQHYISWLNKQDKSKAKAFWQEQLGGLDTPVDISIKKPVADSDLGQYQRQSLKLAPQLSQNLNRLARALQVTQSTLIQGAWGLLLSQYGNCDDVVFGVTVSGRPAQLSGIEQMVGLFINTIPVRVQINRAQGLAEYLRALQQSNLARENYSFLSLADIQNQSDISGASALFDSLVIFENYPVDEALKPADTRQEEFVVSAAHSEEQTNYALTLLAHQAGDSLLFNLGYHQGQIDSRSIERLLGHFETILSQMSQQVLLGEISMLSAQELQQLSDWAMPQLPCGPYQSIVERFEQQVAKTPERLAISCHGAQLNYSELNQKAEALAARIQRAKPQAQVIGIYLERDITMVVAMLAVLKAGYGYLPLDRGYPKARLLEMAEDSQIDAMIATEVLSESIAIIKPDDANTTKADVTIQSNTPELAPAYRIYTSGSTGKPKGVTLSQGNVSALLDWAHQFYSAEQLAVVAAVTPISFDLSVFEIFVPLTCGTRVALMENALHLDDDSITLLNTVPSVLKAAMQEQALPGSLKAINLAGEPLPQALVDSIEPHIPVFNLYGPSEDTVYSTGCRVLPGQSGAVAIGRPIAGSETYVLDQQGRQVPVGVAGELYLGGKGVGLGYHNRAELNQAVFIDSPLQSGQRVYKTGDLVRWREDGQLDYLGRIDSQVKLRGLRIELGEVETRLNSAAKGVQGAILVHNNQLVAFVAGNGDIDAIKAQLQSTLPGHMVPDRFISIDALPLNANGKIDRKQLPSLLQQTQAVSGQNEDGALSATETVLLDIWQGLLKVEHIGTQDDFFTLGGDSIIAIQVVTRARRQGLTLTPRALFDHSTIATLAAYIEQNQGDRQTSTAEQGELSGTTALLPIQHDFFAQQLACPDHYNQTMLLMTPAELSETQCKAIIASLVGRHDALRLGFNPQSMSAEYQPLHEQMFEVVALDSLERQAFSDICSRYQASLNIQTGPLFKAVYFKRQNDTGRLLLAIHHLAVDGVSWRILLDDIRACWLALKQGQTVQLGDKTHSPRAWQQALSQLDLTAQLDYWQAQLSEQALAFCQTDAQTTRQSGQVEGLTLSLDKTSTAALLSQSHTPYKTTIEELLLSALLKAGMSWSGQSNLSIELESHGRETSIVEQYLQTHLDLSETVGWFTSLYPLQLHAAGQDWPTIITAVKTQYRAIPDKGMGFGVLKYLQGQNLPQHHRGILFNYLGQLDSLSESGSDFAMAPEPAGMPVSPQNRAANPLTINAHISDGCLQIALHADTKVLAPEQAARFADCYRQALLQCIEHCAGAQGRLCLADFDNAEVDEATLQQWLKDFPTTAKLYPATPMQQGILFHCLMDQSSEGDIYTTQSYGDLRGPMNVEAFKAAWQLLINRHDVLRTSFVGLSTDTIHQLVQAEVELPFTYLDKRDDNISEQWLSDWRAQDKAKGFAFDPGQSMKGPLMRIALIRRSQDCWHFVWTYHHVLLDGWSLPQLFNEVMVAYQGDAAQLPPAANYEDYIRWLKRRDENQSYEFWREQLEGFESSDPFAAIKQGPLAGRYVLLEHALTAADTDKLKQIAKQNRCTMNVVLQAAWAYLVHRYSGFDDIVFGATVSGRPAELEQVENIVGLFINSIPVRLQFGDKSTVKQLLEDLQKNNVRREEHSFVSLAQIQKQAALAPGSALFESLLAFENYPLSENTQAPSEDDIIAEYLDSDEQTSFPLSLMAYVAHHRSGEQLTLKFGFYDEQFNEAAMQRLFSHLHQLLSALAENGAEQSLAHWQLLPDDEYQQLVYQYNQGQAQYPVDRTIAQLFEQMVESSPQKVAVATDSISYDYQTVNDKANRLAHALLAAGLNKGEFVGLHLGRCAEFVIAALAVFKAGGAYVPLDPNYPQERIAYIVDDAAMQIVISDLRLDCPFDWGDCSVIDGIADHRDLPAHNPQPTELTGRDLAYMIYTSGTTGNPKGVMIEHGGFINSVYEQLRIMHFDQHSRVLAYASWNFDASVIEIFDALLAGGTLVLADEQQVKSPELLTELLVSHQVTHATLPPAIMPFLDPEQLPKMRHLMAAGEHCPMTEVRRWSQNRTLYNGFGPTEASVCFSVTPYSGGEFTMGKAINNKQAYIVDEQMRPVPQGVPGELLIGGSGIARGYHKLPQMSAQKFISNPFIADGGPIYRSGDRVKMLENGELMFLGRIDNQVKVRGHRIETGEIEARLQQLPEVKAAAVTVKSGAAGSQLLAAVVPQSAKPLELWPSVAEFYIYDDLLYRAMATDTRRINAFEGAINAAVKDKIVLEIGPGNELLLTQMCVKAGAKKIYAVELMEQTYLTAQKKLAQLAEIDPQIADKVVLIHGDATQVELPEPADYCVSGIVGSIGGSEGAAKIINLVRHQLKDPANMLPKRTVTNLAAITLDDSAFKLDGENYGFSPIAAHYTREVFSSLGKKFDLRVCLKNFKQDQMLSSIDVMENLDHSQVVPLEDSHTMRLEITKAGRFHGFAAWLNLYTDDNHIMDILEADQSLLPIYLPVSLEGIEVAPGDVITGTMVRTLHHNGLNPNYRFDAQLHRTDGTRESVGFVTLHEADDFCQSPFYRRLFTDGEPNILPEQPKVDVLSEVKNRLAEQLPSYMVPSLFTELDALPLTVNGKIDYKAIAALDVAVDTTADYQAPTNEVEKQLCEIWQAALGCEQVSVSDSFFAVGGDSIIAIGVVAKARNAGLNLSVADVFEYQTISRLAPIVAANQAASLAPQQSSQGDVALWPIAQHFFEQQLPDAHHFNQSVMVNTPATFGETELKQVLRAVIERHDSLRLVINHDKGVFMPLTDSFIDSCIVVESLPSERQQITLRCNHWQSRFDLSQGPLLRAILLKDAQGGEGKLCLIMHHLIVDGVSWRILLSDLKLAWQQMQQQQSISLGAKTHSLQQWRQALDTYAEQITTDERNYWQQQLQKPIPQRLALQKDSSTEQTGTLQSCEFSIDAESTRQLTGPCNDAYLTRINELLLAALHTAWRQWCGESVLPLAMESHGRENLAQHFCAGETVDLSETVGWFTALYPQRLAVDLTADFATTIDQIKTQYRQLPHNGIGFGLLKYINKDATLCQLSQQLIDCEVVFNYLGQMDQALGDSGPFADARLATGYNASPNQPMAQLLAINGMVSEGELSFSLSFSDNRLAQTDVERLSAHFKQALLDLVDHCHSKIHNNRLFEQNSDLIVTGDHSQLDEGIEI